MRLIATLIFLLIISIQIKAQDKYSITDLGNMVPTGINDSGQVSGSIGFGDNQIAIRWENGLITQYPNPGVYSVATGINNHGVMSGYFYSSTLGNRAVIYKNDITVGLLPNPTNSWSEANAINDSGYVAGNYGDNAAVWRGGDPIDLGALSQYGSYGIDLNDSGLVVGYGEAPPSYNDHAFKTIFGGLTDLGTLGGNFALARSVNKLGNIVGRSTDGSAHSHAVIWNPNIQSIQNIGTFGSAAYDINDFNVVVGEDLGGRAFVWKDGVMKDLNTLCDTSLGWVLQKAVAINNLGQIVGEGLYNGQQRAFLLSTIPPRYPVFIVPGIAGTYAANLDFDLGWLLKRGISPDSIQIDPLGRVYDDIIITLENLGYEKGKDLFIVNYDWRLTPGPVDNNIDGRVDGLTGASITSGQFNYGVDYLGWFIKQACERWRQDHNEELDSIDIISHSTGGLVTRTYIQSDAYGAVYDNPNNYKLPKIRNFVMIGVPNRGASKPWNPIQDNWTGDVAYRFVLSKIINRAYQKVLQDKIITGPDGNITKNSIMDSSGVPNKELFISKYVPTIRYLLATYDFIDFGSGLTNINNDVDKRNTILLDLNNGFDINPLNDPNGFLDSANVIVIYGTGETTKFSVIQRTDFELAALQSFTDFTPSTALPGTIWYKDIDFDNNGDGTVPTISSASQFLIDTRATLIEFTTGDHTKLVSQINVQSTILDLLGVPYNLADISTGHSTNYNVVSNIISDPVELVLTDGSGNRIGYTNATGAITEIQNSFWTGNTEGMGYVFGSVQEPINLKLTGLGEDYYVMVSIEDSGKTGGVVLEGFLAAGEVINYPITLNPVSVEQNNSLNLQNFALAQNYPNPFNPTTKISWQSPVGSHQTLKIYDLLGNEVATLVDEYREAGRYEITFNASHLASGVYFYKIQAGGFVETKKMILIR